MARRKWRLEEEGYKDNKWIEVALTEGGKGGIVIAERDVIDGKMRTNAVALSFEEAPVVTTRITELLLEHHRQEQKTTETKKEEKAE
jgi:hypothetical protein